MLLSWFLCLDFLLDTEGTEKIQCIKVSLQKEMIVNSKSNITFSCLKADVGALPFHKKDVK
jgi:hypothetical protein